MKTIRPQSYFIFKQHQSLLQQTVNHIKRSFSFSDLGAGGGSFNITTRGNTETNATGKTVISEVDWNKNGRIKQQQVETQRFSEWTLRYYQRAASPRDQNTLRGHHARDSPHLLVTSPSLRRRR